MRQIGTFCSKTFYDGKNGRTNLTRRPIKQIGTRYSEIFCSGKLYRMPSLLDNRAGKGVRWSSTPWVLREQLMSGAR